MPNIDIVSMLIGVAVGLWILPILFRLLAARKANAVAA